MEGQQPQPVQDLDQVLGRIQDIFRNCLNCVSTAKIFHNVITHNRGTNPVTIMLYYP